MNYKGFSKTLGDSGFESDWSQAATSSFDPSQLSNLMCWVKSDAGLWQDSAKTTPAASNGDPIGAHEDQSGVGNDLLQTSALSKPSLNTAVQLNGYNTIELDGVDDSIFASIASQAQPYAFFMVWLVDDPGDTNQVIIGFAANSTNYVNFLQANDRYDLFAGASLSNGGEAGGGWEYGHFIVNGAGSVNNISGDETTGNAGSSAMDGFGPCFGNAGWRFAAMKYTEFAVVSGVPSADEITNMQSYFQTRYGL